MINDYSLGDKIIKGNYIIFKESKQILNIILKNTFILQPDCFLCVLKRVSLSSAGSTDCSQAQILSSFHSDNDIYVNLFHATARHLERPVPLSFTLSFHFDQRKCMCHEHRALDKQIDSMGGQGDTVSCSHT